MVHDFLQILMLILLISSGQQTHAQTSGNCPFTRLREADLVETYWQYTKTVHSPSGKTLHQGGKTYPSFLHFRYDNTFEEHTNSVHREGKWSLSEGELFLAYRGLNAYCVDRPVSGVLNLAYAVSGASGGRHYAFQQVDRNETPFVRPWYELPTIVVDKRAILKTSPITDKGHPWWAFWHRWQREPTQVLPPLVPITIEVSGGGYYGGLNPVSRQYVRINSEGRLIREVQTQRDGLIVTKKQITRRELEDFVEWIEEQGYFKLAREYDCKDQVCYRRKTQKPKPIPLQVMVSYGLKRHVITVHIWGLDQKQIQYVPCPPVIDQIVETVYRMADRMEL